jgi:UDP-sugar pyrophosphorylase
MRWLLSVFCLQTCYLELYAQWILALQSRARAKTGNKDLELQFAIMTSDDTDTLTRQLLQTHKNFGLTETQLTVFKQGKVPSLIDNDGHFVLDESDPFMLDTKPHGHGDVHSLLYGQGIVERWVNPPAAAGSKRIPVEWIVFFQDTNGLVFRAIPAAVGVSKEKNLHMNSLTVPRAQGDAVGAICTLTREKPLPDAEIAANDLLPNKLTINVEYNQLEGLLGKGVKEPQVPGTNYSIYPGNMNVLVLHAPDYLAVLKDKKGAISEFVNPKYNPDKQSFKKPTRLEVRNNERKMVMMMDQDRNQRVLKPTRCYLSFSFAAVHDARLSQAAECWSRSWLLSVRS